VLAARARGVTARVRREGPPRAPQYSLDGSRPDVRAELGAALRVVDTRTWKAVRRIPTPGGVRAVGVVVAPDGRRVWVTTSHAGTIAVFDPEKMEFTGSIAVGKRPWGIGRTRDGKTLFTANGVSNDVSVVDAEAGRVVATIPVGQAPWGVAVVSK